MEADWDLLAVVRGCTSATTTTAGGGFPATDLHHNPPPPPATTTTTNLQRATLEPAYGGFFSSGSEDLGDLYKPFFPNLKCPPISNHLVGGGGGFIREQEKSQQRPQQQQIVFQQHPQQVKESQVIFGSGASSVAPPSSSAVSILSVGSIFASQSQRTSVLCSPTTSTATTTPQSQQRAKKRKNLQKRVCHVPAEGLSSDMWAWRKYGQKPIKGSPYPRGYYRCSSSKGCLARKQVERNRSNPKMFIVTYTAEHNHPMPTHRNSLAGSTRQKPASGSEEAAAAATAASPSTNSTGNDRQGASSPTASHSSPMTEKGEVKTEYESSGNEMEFPDIENMVMNDDFFVGFEELDDMDTGGDVFLDQIQERISEMEFPWLSNSSSSSSTATAASGS